MQLATLVRSLRTLLTLMVSFRPRRESARKSPATVARKTTKVRSTAK